MLAPGRALQIGAMVAIAGALAFFAVEGAFDDLGSGPIESVQAERDAADRARRQARRQASRPRAGRGGSSEVTGQQIRSLETPGERHLTSKGKPQPEPPGDVTDGVRRPILAAVEALKKGWQLARRLGLLALVVGGGILAARYYARTQRRYARARVVPAERDHASPTELRSFYSQLHALTAERWWRRLLSGQPSVALELAHVAEPGTETGGLSQRLQLGFETRSARSVCGALQSVYENARFGREDVGRINGQYLVRLKRRYPFLSRRLATPDVSEGDAGDRTEDRASTIGALLGHLESVGIPVQVQIVLWPTPRIFERLTQVIFKWRENQLNRDSIRREGAGSRSVATREELEGGAEGVVFRSLFFFDIRIVCDDLRTAESLANVLVAKTKAENALVPKIVRLRRPWVLHRYIRGEGNPLPSLLRGVISTSELSALWALPDPDENLGSIERNRLTRRDPGPRVRRVGAEEGLLRSERGDHLTLHEEDWPQNLAVVGNIGSGKSSMLVPAALRPARDPNSAAVIFDPKGDLWQAILSRLDTRKRVHLLRFANPHAGFSPLHSNLMDSSGRADTLIGALQEMFRVEDGSTQLYQASINFIKTMTIAALEVFEQPTMIDIADLLSVSPTGYAARKSLLTELRQRPELATIRSGVEEFVAQLQKAESAFTQRISAPHNKLQALTEP
ncbi:MAG: hypothetical protein ACR2K6_02900, partial [Solirubrobacterales bacterium]